MKDATAGTLQAVLATGLAVAMAAARGALRRTCSLVAERVQRLKGLAFGLACWEAVCWGTCLAAGETLGTGLEALSVVATGVTVPVMAVATTRTAGDMVEDPRHLAASAAGGVAEVAAAVAPRTRHPTVEHEGGDPNPAEPA